MRFGDDALGKARIETLIDDQCRLHKLFLDIPDVAPGNLSGVVNVYDTSKTDVIIETETDLEVGDFIEINTTNESIRTAAVVWKSGRLAGCKFIAELTPNPDRAPRSLEDLRATVPVIRPNDALLSDGGAEIQLPPAELQKLPIGMRMSMIIGSAVLLWTIIGASAFWILF